MKRFGLVTAFMVGATLMWGCESPNDPNPRDLSVNRSRVEAVNDAMIKNALKSDMALADVHFEPHSARLNGLGEHRLQQFAEILVEDGGTLRLETRSPDAELNQERLRAVAEYLAATGVARERIEVVSGLRGGRGMTAKEAIQVRDVNFDPNTQTLTTLIGGGMGGGMGSQ